MTLSSVGGRNRGERRMNALDCMRRVYQMDGLRGFYRGMSASYAGISETVIHFVIYESIKRQLLASKARGSMDGEEGSVKDAADFVGMMLAAATSKTCATSIAYPHGSLPSHCVSEPFMSFLIVNKRILLQCLKYPIIVSEVFYCSI